ncbi:MAG: TonB-dependent receptor [Fulvivirga sp.]|uniref:TonB-dependent receptor n=1 Tax=Fulvivirga sp. TaxID=1931237 RepID=UPI0032EE42F7
MKKNILLILMLMFSSILSAQSKFTLSGSLKDAETGEDLIGATVYVQELKTGTVSNVYGFYSLSIPAGVYTITVSYIGYQQLEKQVNLKADLLLQFDLFPEVTQLKEIVITDKMANENVEIIKMSSEKMPVSLIKKSPAFMGEVDVLKTIQALPGVQSAGEGTTGFFVRGGGVDQNMILLDEAIVYNPSHLMGFFSVFNADAIKEVELYKGGIPAQYGGRVSSLLDIRMKDGNNKKLSGNGGIGTIASRFTLEGPIVKDKSSFIVSGRRTYADLFLKASDDDNVKNTKLYFYDLNTKLNIKLGERDRLFLSGYFGDDVFKYKNAFHWSWGNRTATLRWNHIFNNKLFANFTYLYSNFNYNLGADSGPTSFEWDAYIRDLSFKGDFEYFFSSDVSFNAGVSTIHHKFQPGDVEVKGSGFQNDFVIDKEEALESAIYLGADIKLSERLQVQPGLRYSLLQNIGGTTYTYEDGNPIPTDTVFYENGEFYHSQGGFEPRINARYTLNAYSSIKASYNRMFQYLHLASNTTSSIPLDLYIASNELIKPQIADQLAVGYFRNFQNNTWEFSTEVYYKWLQNQIDFKDNADILLNKHVEREILSGEGEAYGVEFMLKKTTGKLTGWASYTLSKTERTINGINDGNPYSPRQDRPHSINLMGSYQINKRIQIGAFWNYASGMPITLASSSFEYGGVVVPVYDERNGYRLPASHRLDLSVTIDSKKNDNRKWEGSWNFSLFNVYGRKNPFSLMTRQNQDNPKVTEAVQMSLIGTIVPSVTYNIKF